MEEIKSISVRTSSLRGLCSCSNNSDYLEISSELPIKHSRFLFKTRAKESAKKTGTINYLKPLVIRQVHHYNVSQIPKERAKIKMARIKENLRKLESQDENIYLKKPGGNSETAAKMKTLCLKSRPSSNSSGRLVPVCNTKSFEQYMLKRKGLCSTYRPLSHLPAAKKKNKVLSEEHAPPRIRMLSPVEL